MAKLLVDGMEETKIAGGSSFTFSNVKIEDLGASEYTLVCICRDMSGSVAGFSKSLEDATKAIIEACSKSPRADNLLIRVLDFDSRLEEVHGFKGLQSVDMNDYVLTPRGMTALYDASYSGLGSILTYAKQLVDQDFNVNGICFVITDGMDNESKTTPKMIADMKKSALQKEEIESILTILIGVNDTDPGVVRYLQTFEKQAEFDQYVNTGEATKENLAKLASFVSKSISSQSQSLGTGGPSQTLSF